MKRFFLAAIILMLPVYAFAGYTVTLKNGTEISGVKTYNETGDQVYIYTDTGYMIFPKKDILSIEGSETQENTGTETDIKAKEDKAPDAEQSISPEKAGRTPASRPRSGEDGVKFKQLSAEYQAIMSDIRALEARENSLVVQINEKTGKRFSYNTIQLKQLEKEIEPLKKELAGVQQKKSELVTRKNAIESEMKELQ